MLVSMPTNVSASVLGDDAQVIKIMADVGFDAFDISVERPVEWDKFPNTYVMDLPDFKEHAQYLHDLGQSLGIPCCAAHAPCATSSADPEINEILFHKLVRAAEAAAIVGANAIVVHPILYPANHPLREHQWQLNLDLYRRLLPYARDFGIRVAVENLIEWKNDYRPPRPQYAPASGGILPFPGRAGQRVVYRLSGLRSRGLLRRQHPRYDPDSGKRAAVYAPCP